MTDRLRALATNLSLTACVLLAGALTACSGVSVRTEGAPADVAGAQTYAFLGGDSLDDPSPLADKTLRADLDQIVVRQIATRGLRPVAEARNPDLLVKYWVRADPETPMAAPLLGAQPPQALHPGMPVFREGLLAVDFLRPATLELLWRGTVTLVLKQDRKKTLEEVERGLARALKDFPGASR